MRRMMNNSNKVFLLALPARRKLVDFVVLVLKISNLAPNKLSNTRIVKMLLLLLNITIALHLLNFLHLALTIKNKKKAVKSFFGVKKANKILDRFNY